MEKGTRPTPCFPAPSTMSARSVVAASVIRALKFARQIPLNFRSTSSIVPNDHLVNTTTHSPPTSTLSPPQLNFLAAVAPRSYITTCTVSARVRTHHNSRWPPHPLRASHRLALPICPTRGTKSSPRGVLLSRSWSGLPVSCPSRRRPLLTPYPPSLGRWRVRTRKDNLHQHALLHHHQELCRPQAPPPEAGRQDG